MRRALPLIVGAVLPVLFCACQQTLRLDDLAAGGGSGSGGFNGFGGYSGGNGGGNGGTSTSDAGCVSNHLIAFQPDTPQILVALDRSSEMNAAFNSTSGGSGGSGGSQLQAALNDIQSSVSRYGTSRGPHIQFTFLGFPDPGNSCDAMNGCCSSAVTSSYPDFQSASSCTDPTSTCFSTRPTAAALATALSYYNSNGISGQHSNERFVLLITDDDPKGACPDTNACGDAIAAVSKLASSGITTELIAIGAGTDCLLDIAGAQPASPVPYFTAEGPEDLPHFIDQIGGTVYQNACRLTLAAPPSSGSLVVVFDHVRQTQDSGSTGNGWNYSGGDTTSTRVTLHGSLCQSYLFENAYGASSGLQLYDGCPPSDHQSQSP